MPSISKFFLVSYSCLKSEYFLLISTEKKKSIREKWSQHFSTRSMFAIKGYTPDQRLTQKVKSKEKKNSSRISKGGSRVGFYRKGASFVHPSFTDRWPSFDVRSGHLPAFLNARPSANIIICRSFVRLRWTYRTH